MKKVVILFGVLFLINSIFAAELTIKENLDQGESFLAKLSGNFAQPILEENIFFYRDQVSIPSDFSLAKIGNDYYIFSLLKGKVPGNYSISVKNAKYYSQGKLISDDLTRTFSITENFTDFSINPGFVFTRDVFSIEIQNFLDSGLEIEMNSNKTAEVAEKGFFESLFGEETPSKEIIDPEKLLTLNSGEIKKFYFQVNSTQSKIYFLRLTSKNSDYTIPVYFLAPATPSEIQDTLSFNPAEFDLIMNLGSKTSKNLTIKNSGDSSLGTLFLSFSSEIRPYVSVSASEINSLSTNSSVEISLNFSTSEIKETLKGYLLVKDNINISSTFPITLNFVNESSPVVIEEKNLTKEEISYLTKTCVENNGAICNSTEKCDGESVAAKDDKCCLGTCKIIKKSSTGKVIGWTIFLILFGIFIWFFKFKYPKIKREVNLLETAKGFFKRSKIQQEN